MHFECHYVDDVHLIGAIDEVRIFWGVITEEGSQGLDIVSRYIIRHCVTCWHCQSWFCCFANLESIFISFSINNTIMVIIPNVESSIYQMLLSLLIHLLGVSVVCVELDASFINGGEFKNFIDTLSTSTECFLEIWWVVLLAWHVITLQLVDFAFCI